MFFVALCSPAQNETNTFRLPGELYSVKIMWPRTLEEKHRRRNTGFVCFIRRRDAEDALETCDETDPFNNGRQLMLRWGKNVKQIKRDDSTKPFVQRRRNEGREDSNKSRKDDSTVPPTSNTSSDKPIKRSTSDSLPTSSRKETARMNTLPEMKKYDPEIHAPRAIHVEKPTDQSRFHFISTTASFVAKDPELEQKLKDEERSNPLFEFLRPCSHKDEFLKEKQFYRWRVYSFCQGDTYSIWRTEPVRFIWE